MRRVIATALTAAGFMIGPASAEASRTWMQDGEMRVELTNRKLVGVYPNHVAWSEQIAADGTTDYEEPGQRRPGRWTITGELFCFTYAQVHQGGCFRVVKHSPNCYELYTASIGGVPPPSPPPASAMSWNGRMWRDGERATCEDKIVS